MHIVDKNVEIDQNSQSLKFYKLDQYNHNLLI